MWYEWVVLRYKNNRDVSAAQLVILLILGFGKLGYVLCQIPQAKVHCSSSVQIPNGFVVMHPKSKGGEYFVLASNT